MKWSWLVIACYLLVYSIAQGADVAPAEPDVTDKSAPQAHKLSEVVISATRSAEYIEEVPQTMTVVDKKALETKQSLNVNEALREEPGIFAVQAAPQGTPIVRGLNGNKVLYLWNGIPINNGSTFSGPNATLNQFPLGAVDRIEVIRGPGSVQYGSGAIGGVINLISKTAPFSDTPEIGGDTSFRYGTVDHEYTEIGNFWATAQKYSLIGGLTRQDVGNYMGGVGAGAQNDTGYTATGGNFDFAYKPMNNQTLRVSGIYNSRDDIQYYASSKVNADGVPKTYDPYERRGIVRFDYEINNLGFLSDSLKAYAYYQGYGQIRDSNSYTASTKTLSTTATKQQQNILGGGLQNTMAYAGNNINYGFDYRSEDLMSTLALTNVTNNPGKTPDGTYDVLDGFIIDQVRILQNLTVTFGGRLEQTHLHATPQASDVIPNAGYTLQDIAVDKTWLAGTWSVGVVYNVTPSLDIAANAASGYRAPTFSDVLSTGTPVYSTKVASIPSPNVGPEKAITYEVGPRYHTNEWTAMFTAYWTQLYDYIRSTDSGTVTIGQGTYTAQINGNNGEGYICGLELSFKYKPNDWSFFGNAAYTEGEDTKYHEFLRFIPPLYGTVGVRYDHPSKRWWAEASEDLVDRLYHHAPKDQTDVGFSSDPGYGSPSATNPALPNYQIPGYVVTNLRAGWTAWKEGKRSLDLTLNINNLFDKDYREAYSQQEFVAPGFNCVMGAKVIF